MFSGAFKSAHKRIDELAMKLGALGICFGAVALLWPSVNAALALSSHDDRYIEIIAAPLISAYLMYWDRQNIFSKAHYSPRIGFPLLSCGAILCLIVAGVSWTADPIIRLDPAMFALILVWQTWFIVCFGLRSFRAALYPLCCLWLAVPIPPRVIDSLTMAYQHGSAALSFLILDLSGVSVLQNGTSFSIPGLDFTIAPECSGIKSGLAFLLVSILAVRLYLKSGWARSLVILFTIPIAMFKNAIRIVVTASLAAYVDRAFIDGPFHHKYGGLIFSPLDFVFFVPLVLGLRRLENLSPGEKSSRQAAAAVPSSL